MYTDSETGEKSLTWFDVIDGRSYGIDTTIRIKGLKWTCLGIRVIAFFAHVFGMKLSFVVDLVEE